MAPPGAALLAGAGTVDGGCPAAVGAFLVTGVLIGLSGLIPALGGHPRGRRASFGSGLDYLVLALFSAALVTLVSAAAFWALAAGLLVRWILMDRGTPV